MLLTKNLQLGKRGGLYREQKVEEKKKAVRIPPSIIFNHIL